MNNTFNLTRFLSYFKKHSIDNGKTYLMSTAVLVGILVLSLFSTIAMSNGYLSTDWQMTVLMFCVLLGGSIFTSLAFADLGDKRKAIPMLTLPVSHFEKYLVSWLYTYVIFLIVSVGSFYLVDIAAVSFSKPSTYWGASKMLDLTNERTPWILPLGVFTLFHAFAFWGSVFFNKLHFIKASFVFFICLIAYNLFHKAMMFFISEDNVKRRVTFNGSLIEENGHTYFFTPDNFIIKLMPFVFVLGIIMLWTSAYFKLKEKEV